MDQDPEDSLIAPQATGPFLTLESLECEEAAAATTPAAYGTHLLDDVHSPSTPHPFTMSPPPPPGEPPRLLRNKRPHGLFYGGTGSDTGGCTAPAASSASVMAACASTAVACEVGSCSTGAIDATTIGTTSGTGPDTVVTACDMDTSLAIVDTAARACSPVSGRSSPSSPSSSSSSSSDHDSGGGGAVGATRRSSMCSSQTCDSPRDAPMCTSVAVSAQCAGTEMHLSPCGTPRDASQPDEPEMPPGPPPAKMAPPPPVGPPPSLPLDRAELKRGVEEPAPSSSKPGKRLRSLSASSVPSGGPAFGPGPPAPGCSSDGESSSSTSDAEDARPEEQIGGEFSGSRWPGQTDTRDRDDALEESYHQAPPAARWVWDRFLQQEGNLASAVTLEKRMLLALDALHVGTDAQSS